MSAKTKIVVFKLKELLLTAIFVVLAIVLIVLLILILSGKSHDKQSDVQKTGYTPGVYTASIILSSNPVEIEVTVDSEQIKSIDMVNSSNAVTTMYPLITASLESVSEQIIKNNSTDNITYNEDNKYTSVVLVNAIKQALEKARP